jgi:hypothetical protein
LWNSLILSQTSLWASCLTHFVENQITVKRTEQNNPLGLEVQLHITEAVCPALSEPGNQSLSTKLAHSFRYFNFACIIYRGNHLLTGLRAFLRFMTGVSVCLNRGDVDPKAQQVHPLIIVLQDWVVYIFCSYPYSSIFSYVLTSMQKQQDLQWCPLL